MTDKPGCISLAELDEIRQTVAATGRIWSVTFSERFGVKCVTKAGDLVRDGRIGKVVQTLGLGPHRIGDRAHLAGGAGRPDWFYDKSRYGGILTDIASHQIDQFLWFTGSTEGEVVASTVGNFANPDTPGLRTSARSCSAATAHRATSASTGTHRRVCRPGVTGG